jgi:hypothetical protein
MLIRIYDVNRPVSARETIFNEREQYAVFFVVAVEECADVPRFIELRTCKGHRRSVFLHDVFPPSRSTAPVYDVWDAAISKGSVN